MDALKNIQQELKAPKNQMNSFGGYKYRSAEDILEAVKPLLAKHGAELTLSDDIVEVGDRIYVKATATLTDGKEQATVHAFAREPEEKRGMDASQITGTASSYARKYALNGLFLIDDTKDADTDEFRKQTNGNQQPAKQPQSQQQPQQPAKKITKATVDAIEGLIAQTNSDRPKLLAFFKVNKLEDLTAEQAKKCVAMLKSKQQ